MNLIEFKKLSKLKLFYYKHKKNSYYFIYNMYYNININFIISIRKSNKKIFHFKIILLFPSIP